MLATIIKKYLKLGVRVTAIRKHLWNKRATQGRFFIIDKQIEVQGIADDEHFYVSNGRFYGGGFLERKIKHYVFLVEGMEIVC